ncbi:cilia- and flagella-associated protein 251-like [Leptopilina boulardi]|uniref:cilia- and flagella-associated protein 251-like n=1 Tax=Leptopilina boulardi TaxID=63433 RepID=UPI0021F54F79|nr:cilia- and flagella-associated protein 251-like [Leptopilina boulardi]
MALVERSPIKGARRQENAGDRGHENTGSQGEISQWEKWEEGTETGSVRDETEHPGTDSEKEEEVFSTPKVLRKLSTSSLPDYALFSARKRGRPKGLASFAKITRKDVGLWQKQVRDRRKARGENDQEEEGNEGENNEREEELKDYSDVLAGMGEMARAVMKMSEETNKKIEDLGKEIKVAREESERKEEKRDEKMDMIRGEVREIRDMWANWEERWRGEKEDLMEKVVMVETTLERVERKRSAEMSMLEKRVGQLEIREEATGSRQGTEEGQTGELERKVADLSRLVERLEKEKGNVGLQLEV